MGDANTVVLGKTLPRITTAEQVPLTPDNTLGFDCIEFANTMLGVRLNPWQEYFVKRALEIREDGSFRYRTVLLLVARQQGKSTVMIVVALYLMFIVSPGELVLGTAQDLDTSEGTWMDAVEMVEKVPVLERMIKQVSKVNGKKALTLTNNSKWKVAAAKRTGGRGKSAALVLMDELREHLSFEAWNAISNTTIAREEAQIWGVSNAGDTRSVVLKSLRDKAIAQKDDPKTRTLICEWSAEPDAELDDLDAIAQANPSLGYTVSMEAIEEARNTSPEAGFRTENLCQWVETLVEGPFKPEELERCLDPMSEIALDSPLYVAIDTSDDRGMSYVAVAGYRDDGVPHVEVIAQRAYTDWVPKFLSSGLSFTPDAILVQGRGCHASSLIDFIEKEGVTVNKCEGSNLTAACGQFFDWVTQSKIRWRDQPVLSTALTEVVKKNLGDAFIWDRVKSPVDVAPLCAATFAVWGLINEVKTEGSKPSAYEGNYGEWWQ